jgi:hypothetical protein
MNGDTRERRGSNSVYNSVVKEVTSTNGSMSPKPNVDIVLPQPKGYLIPLNRDGHRIDTVLPKASQEDQTILRKHIQAGQKLCNDYQLIGVCGSDDCQFDHSPLAPELLNVLRHMARQIPCARKGGCRKGACYKGHNCAKSGCKNCKLGYKAHGVDTNVHIWIDPEDHGFGERAESRTSLDDADGVSLGSPIRRSRKNSSPLLPYDDIVAEEV